MMNQYLAAAKPYIEATMEDTFDIIRPINTDMPDGSTSQIDEVVSTGNKCRISFSKTEDGVPTTHENPTEQKIKLFCRVDSDVGIGDRIKAYKKDENGEIIVMYDGVANAPNTFLTHKEIEIITEGSA